jgi:hypothetical protein
LWKNKWKNPIAAGLNIIKDPIIFFHKQAVQGRIWRRLTFAGLFGTSCDKDSSRETGLLDRV